MVCFNSLLRAWGRRQPLRECLLVLLWLRFIALLCANILVYCTCSWVGQKVLSHASTHSHLEEAITHALWTGMSQFSTVVAFLCCRSYAHCLPQRC